MVDVVMGPFLDAFLDAFLVLLVAAFPVLFQKVTLESLGQNQKEDS